MPIRESELCACPNGKTNHADARLVSRRASIRWTRAELETHVRDEYSTFSWLLEPMLERVGFRIQEKHGADSKTYLAYSCIKAL